MKPITIDPKLQTILENLNNAKKLFNEVYTQINIDGIHIYETAQRDFMSDVDSAISNTSYMVAQKVEYDVRKGLYTVEEGGHK
ncbi:hypothetical protein DWW69_09725 [Bacteroides sp. AF16-49]|uniref:hypothetical protein n=1 Tax=Bacteroides sp. AF16-49 TaxID=2292192 RepID=UPI000F00C009|nr:hypothetical protein [Bacteroides sp. AF16-49]RHR75558.1 hypothetical protein DWW69_09725 [Bacteroides sp. AF16-49]